jgi:hypothetical protein
MQGQANTCLPAALAGVAASVGVVGAPTKTAPAPVPAPSPLCWAAARATCCMVTSAVLEGEAGRVDVKLGGRWLMCACSATDPVRHRQAALKRSIGPQACVADAGTGFLAVSELKGCAEQPRGTSHHLPRALSSAAAKASWASAAPLQLCPRACLVPGSLWHLEREEAPVCPWETWAPQAPWPVTNTQAAGAHTLPRSQLCCQPRPRAPEFSPREPAGRRGRRVPEAWCSAPPRAYC